MEKTEEELLEELSSLEHEQWIGWSKSVASDIEKLIDLIDVEKLSQEDLEFIDSQNERLRRWESYWVSYRELDERTKDQDRVYARKTLDLIKNK